MARKAREENQQTVAEYSYTSAASAVEDVDNSAVLVDQAPLVASAVDDRDAMIVQEVSQPRRYRVVYDALVMNRGARTLLRRGKIIDEVNYDLVQLASQGVQVEEFVA